MTKKTPIVILSLFVASTGCQQAPEPTAAPRGSVSAAASASPSSPSATSIKLVPKVSLGPIRLGMTQAEVDKLGLLQEHPQYSAMTSPYHVSYDAAGKADQVKLSLKYASADVTIGSLTIPRTATFDEVKTLLGDCQDRPPAKGGNQSDCRGGLVVVSLGSGALDEVWLAAVLP